MIELLFESDNTSVKRLWVRSIEHEFYLGSGVTRLASRVSGLVRLGPSVRSYGRPTSRHRSNHGDASCLNPPGFVATRSLAPAAGRAGRPAGSASIALIHASGRAAIDSGGCSLRWSRKRSVALGWIRVASWSRLRVGALSSADGWGIYPRWLYS